ncbi:MAG TPA: PTS system mannose/fructose/sorbose family transporter subunit IID [Enorma massiliensis]|uniref:PTS system mannose/fructose/sorbose family transporter subunit IID n=1 Tax=Enorma massiliensis TaxID=1472761 RepID=UPI001D89A327|nr:PTS system mannose/fructose/sorbose family transporter subunit IID [Enorma massiliensis]HJG63108.1 PTS system mannose/fructose/sorbose family transporter subunit IID [Enorma massiliensis]
MAETAVTTAPQKGISTEDNAVLRKMFIMSHSVFMNFNMTKMEANCFTNTMAPAIEQVYVDDPEGKREAYLRHQAFFNTHAVALDFIAGLSYALEKDCAEGKVPGQTIEAIKASLMGPTAGMFDSLFFNCLRVIGAGIAIGLCSQGNIAGTFIFILLYGVTQSILKWFLLKAGYTLGTSFIDSVYNSGLMQVATKAASILGVMMVGCMTATTVGFPLNWTVTIGDTSLVVLDLFESIYPGILSVAIVLIMLAFIKKGVRPIVLIFGLLIFCLLGAAVGIF